MSKELSELIFGIGWSIGIITYIGFSLFLKYYPIEEFEND